MPESSKWTLVAWALAAGLAVLALVRVASPGGDGGAPPPVAVDGGERRERMRGGAAGPGVYVHVAGRVRRPGLYRMPAGARVAAAIEAAGGPTRRAGLSAINLAARVEDGQQVLVPREGAVPAAGATGAAGATAAPGGASAAAKLSLGSATIEQLDSLDGIGPTLAKRIVAFRDAHGGFRSVGQLREVEGIGDKRFAALSRALGP